MGLRVISLRVFVTQHGIADNLSENISHPACDCGEQKTCCGESQHECYEYLHENRATILSSSQKGPSVFSKIINPLDQKR
ncbi:hypothetical protein Bhyg_09818 [Pseudolycoriella hygida]|uniref:Uncharacterized protein n=1 Tax=Pseudolycoriella hygida TaxID=35572 RepID=A0A9Q0MV68_9DIPT|nr:hypothetical protein Bhyg_09818 [Pseudolycoriella hygida]